MTIADWLTLARIIIAPIVFFLFFFGNTLTRIIAFVLFGLGAISDTLDGYIARKTRLSQFGKLWDPIADKILTGLALIALASIGVLPLWITFALIIRDIVVTTIRMVKIKKKGKIILPVLIAKLKTTFEMIMIVGLLLWAAIVGDKVPTTLYWIIHIYGAIVVIMSWGTGIHYIIKSKRI
ncbi:CDP-diacylglycerol--glycerol-3-phosphate 3-phosphatidyltransferase [bacterium]|nr:MAG: CDP-diacylglycerol--glycerol-3-phosphate 3-phosphatidyltransferase [bacterium]